MKKLLMIMLWLVFWTYFILYISLIILNSRQPQEIREIRGHETICEFVLERNYNSTLTDYCVEGDKLYLLWGSIGILEVYSLDGKYQKSFAFETIRNGEDRLEKDSNSLWLKTKNHKVFRFHNGLYLEELDYNEFRNTEDRNVFVVNGKYDSKNGSKYVRDFISIKQVAPDGSIEPIIQFSFPSIAAQGITTDLLHIGVMLLLAFLLWRIKHNT